jgi:plastocyanin
MGAILKRASVFAALGLLLAGEGATQPLTHRTPNIEGTWVTSPWNLHFQFNHRFRVFGDDADILDLGGDAVLDNSPTFTLSLGLWAPLTAGIKYASAPAIRNPTNNNEWFPYLKVAPLRRADWSVSLLAGYNTQAESFDGELASQAELGPLLLVGAVRGFTDALHRNELGLALTGGLGARLTNFLVLTADVADLVAGPVADAAWSAGLQLAIPFTPHTFSLQVSNAAATTPQEASFGGFDVGDRNEAAWGFEFTVPFSGFARWGRIFDRGGEDAEGRGSGATRVRRSAARVVEIEIRDLRFQPDTVRVPVGGEVRWINRDAVGHTSTAEDGEWRSPLIGPGETYTTRFERAGEFPYHCTPHPFMRGVIIVEAPGPS